jgi:hypothetical protein
MGIGMALDETSHTYRQVAVMVARDDYHRDGSCRNKMMMADEGEKIQAIRRSISAIIVISSMLIQQGGIGGM